jgi:drug/metabolite transporter (DMT)-like permease
MAVTWIEISAGFVLVAAVGAFLAPSGPDGSSIVRPDVRDTALLLVLAILCTLIPYAVALAALRHVSAFTAQLAINLEPVYAICIAVAFLGEARELDTAFFVGVGIVLAAVFGHGYLQLRLTDERRSV